VCLLLLLFGVVEHVQEILHFFSNGTLGPSQTSICWPTQFQSKLKVLKSCFFHQGKNVSLGAKNKENKALTIKGNASGIFWLSRTLQFMKSINSPVPHLYSARAERCLWYRFSRPLVLTFADLRSGYSGVECVGISRKYRELKRQSKVVPSPPIKHNAINACGEVEL
jgi:hypothetical protein